VDSNTINKARVSRLQCRRYRPIIVDFKSEYWYKYTPFTKQRRNLFAQTSRPRIPPHRFQNHLKNIFW